MNCHSATYSAPYFDSINSWSRSCDVDAGSTLTLDNVAHERPNRLMFMKSALVFV